MNPKPKRKSPKSNVPPMSSILAHLQSGLTAPEIAKMYGLAECTVYTNIRKHGIDIQAFKQWKQRKADILSHTQMKVLEVANKKIPETGFRDLMTGFGILNNAERLERGQATANIGVDAILSSLSSLEEQERVLRARLGLGPEAPSSTSESPTPESD